MIGHIPYRPAAAGAKSQSEAGERTNSPVDDRNPPQTQFARKYRNVAVSAWEVTLRRNANALRS